MNNQRRTAGDYFRRQVASLIHPGAHGDVKFNHKLIQRGFDHAITFVIVEMGYLRLHIGTIIDAKTADALASEQTPQKSVATTDIAYPRIAAVGTRDIGQRAHLV